MDKILDQMQAYLALIGKEEAEVIHALLQPLPAWQGPLFLGWLKIAAGVLSILTEPTRGKSIDPNG